MVPRAEPQPAFSVRLLPNAFEAKDGNAAIHYLHAIAFAEQSIGLQAKLDFERRNHQAAVEAGKSPGELPPHSWRISRPEELPLQEVKDYLVYTEFQTRYLRQAWQRKQCDFDRRILEVDSPLAYLLPEIQSMRELAWQQQLRFLVAIAEDRVDDAVEIFGQQLAIGHHLSQEPFLVSSLVGIACAGIGWTDSFFLSEHPQAPNLYWALAALPNPLVDLGYSLAFEGEMLFEQFKELRDVDENPRSDLYWSRFVDRMGDVLQEFADQLGFPQKRGINGFAEEVVTGVPGARRYLLEVVGMTGEQIDHLPAAQVYFLAVRRFHERFRDEWLKLKHVPYQKLNEPAFAFRPKLDAAFAEYGSMTSLSKMVFPAVQSALTASTRNQQQLALLQTVESIRHHLATRGNSLPNSLDELELPAPLDPASGEAFEYFLHDQGATLRGTAFPNLRYQLDMRVAESDR